MFVTLIQYFSKPHLLACDGRCTKAWGVNNRPQIQLSDDEDDYIYIADNELGDAPVDPGTCEGGHGKPSSFEEMHNEWCARECERSTVFPLEGKRFAALPLTDFSTRVYNQPWRYESD